MDRATRIAWLVDHSRRPRYRGKLLDADARVPGGNPGCGDIITLYLKAKGGEDRVAAVSFEGVGCTLSQAAASILAERTNRLTPTFEEVLAFSYEEMLDLLGRDIASSRPQCATLALGTLKGAVKTVEMNRKLRAAGHTDEEIGELRRAIAAQAEGTGLVLGEGAERAARAGAAPLPDVLVGP
ncbi:MAG: iron-sulfur cluster assembly scaffold protein [Gemmatimonadales bacterium]|nr:iron-sulfur cluster assembly scaffold protein [Gemmatimonadales bacterium]